MFYNLSGKPPAGLTIPPMYPPMRAVVTKALVMTSAGTEAKLLWKVIVLIKGARRKAGVKAGVQASLPQLMATVIA